MKGTNVYNPAWDNLGTIDDIMIDKASGRVIYAVMSFRGFLGMGEKYYALPWKSAGTVLGGAMLTAGGKSDKAEGRVQNAIDGLKDALKKK